MADIGKKKRIINVPIRRPEPAPQRVPAPERVPEKVPT
jgi:hypothetical protein